MFAIVVVASTPAATHHGTFFKAQHLYGLAGTGDTNSCFLTFTALASRSGLFRPEEIPARRKLVNRRTAETAELKRLGVRIRRKELLEVENLHPFDFGRAIALCHHS